MKRIFLYIGLFLSLVLFTSCDIDDIKDFIHKEHPSDEDDGDDGTQLDVGQGLVANDLEAHPMQELEKPGYLQTVTDPSFGTTIRRISDAEDGSFIVPIYSTIQAWNADESYMILYESGGRHRLLDGMNYNFIRYLDDVTPTAIEQIWWDFDDPDKFFYVDSTNQQLTEYSVSTQEKNEIANLQELVDCPGGTSSGNDIQMMSSDSDVVGFRCGDAATYYYRISTGEITQFEVDEVREIAAMPAPSGELFYHGQAVYGANGQKITDLNEAKTEHSSLGRLADGTDAHFAVAFAESPQGGCFGNILAHDLTTGECIQVISEDQGYDYSKSGTHISALAHRNPGWIAASMIGFEKDGQRLLDQELVVARVEKGNIQVYRIGHHRSDEDEFDYWGEPHAVISPTGTRVLFGSDWSGADDGKSVDSYVVELPAFEN